MSYERNYLREEFFVQAGIEDERLPHEGVHPRQINGIWMWVTPKDHPEAKFIRHLCWCPICGKEMAFGRLGQHMRKMHRR